MPESPIPDEPVYPIVPKFNEKYSMFCIMTTNELDETWLRNVLNMHKMASYKNSAIAPSYVIDCDSFKKSVEELCKTINFSDDEVETI